jgi:hypothetical protein
LVEDVGHNAEELGHELRHILRRGTILATKADLDEVVLDEGEGENDEVPDKPCPRLLVPKQRILIGIVLQT